MGWRVGKDEGVGGGKWGWCGGLLTVEGVGIAVGGGSKVE